MYLQSTPYALHLVAGFANALHALTAQYAAKLAAGGREPSGITLGSIEYFRLTLESLLPPSSRYILEMKHKLDDVEGIHSTQHSHERVGISYAAGGGAIPLVGRAL